MHSQFTGSALYSLAIHTTIFTSLLTAVSCTSLDAGHELRSATEAARRVTGSIDPAKAWALSVEGESSAWNGKVPLTYDNAVAVALQGDPGIRRSLAVIVGRRAWYVQKGLPPNPTVTFDIGIAVDGLGGAPLMVQGFQMLSWLWKNPHRIAAAEAELRAAIYDAAFRCVDVTIQTRNQLAAVLAAQQVLTYDEQCIGIVQQNVELVRAQVEAGELPRLELDREVLDHEEAIETVVASESALKGAKLKLLAIMGRPTSSTDWVAIGDLPPAWDIPGNEQELLDLAVTGRLDVASAHEAVLKIQADLDLAKTKHLPEVGIGLGFNRNFSDRKAITPGTSITTPILDNGDPAVALQMARLDAALMNLLSTTEAAQRDVLANLNRYRATRNRTRIIRERQLQAAVAAQERTKAAYREGVVDLNALLIMQRQRITVERNLVMQELMTMNALCDLRRSVGGSFDPELNTVEAIKIEARPPATGQEDAS